jgi:archaellum biogenesis protein FlaJ (TadC family)
VPQSEELVGGIGLFAVQDLTLVTYTVVMVVFTLTVANSLAPMFAAGGSGLKIATFLSPMCLTSGLILGAIPIITPLIFAV